MAGLPETLYYVLLKPGGKPLGYRQKGGGTYTDKKYAESQYKNLKAYGSNVELHAGVIDWTKIAFSENDENEGQPTLW